MRARILSGLVMVILVLVAACAAKPIGFELEVKVLLDGKPVKNASILVDGVAEGSTDAQGRFAKTLSRVPEEAIRLTVQKEEGKFRAKTWDKTFAIKSRKDSEPAEKQSFTAELQRFVTIAVTEAGKPLAGAYVSVDGKDLGQSQASGTVEYVFGKWPKDGLHVSVKKDGFGETRFVYRGESGDRVTAGLYNEAVVTIEVLEDRNGRITSGQGRGGHGRRNRGRRHQRQRCAGLSAQRHVRRDRAGAYQRRRICAGEQHPAGAARRAAPPQAVFLFGRGRAPAHGGPEFRRQHRRRGHLGCRQENRGDFQQGAV